MQGRERDSGVLHSTAIAVQEDRLAAGLRSHSPDLMAEETVIERIDCQCKTDCSTELSGGYSSVLESAGIERVFLQGRDEGRSMSEAVKCLG